MTLVPGGGFSDWVALDRDGVERAPDVPCAVQLATRDHRLIKYPNGKAAMVFYFYAARSAKEALRRVFADELEENGARGQGPLSYRTLAGGADVQEHMTKVYDEFVAHFGAPPILHATDDE